MRRRDGHFGTYFRRGVATDVNNALLEVHLGLDDARPLGRQEPARQSMQLSRDRDHD